MDGDRTLAIVNPQRADTYKCDDAAGYGNVLADRGECTYKSAASEGWGNVVDARG
jgi:hypothetical protein